MTQWVFDLATNRFIPNTPGAIGAPVDIGPVPPEYPIDGGLWWSTVEPIGLFMWDGDEWLPVDSGTASPVPPPEGPFDVLQTDEAGVSFWAPAIDGGLFPNPQTRVLLYHGTGGLGTPPLDDLFAEDAGLPALIFKGSGPTRTVEIWTWDGAQWIRGNPTTVPASAAAVSLPGGTPGSKTGIGAAWVAYPAKPNDPIIFALYATASYLKMGSGDVDSDWATIGDLTPFATSAEILAGTRTRAAIDPAGLRSTTIVAPSTGSAATAADHDRIPRLNASGQIDAALLPITGGLTFKGAADLSLPASVPATSKNGDYLAHNGEYFAPIDPGFVGAEGSVDPGDMVLYDGALWHVIQGNVPVELYVPKDGATVMGAEAQLIFGREADATILDGGENLGKLANVLIDAGGPTKESVLKVYRLTTAGTVPSGLSLGELAVNIPDRKLYAGDAAGASQLIGGTKEVFVSDTAPVGAPADALWWNSATGQLFVNYQDQDSLQFVEAVAPMPGLEDAPNDGVAYLRKSGLWDEASTDDIAGLQTALNNLQTAINARLAKSGGAAEAMTGQLNLAPAGVGVAPLKFTTSGAPTGTLQDGMCWMTTNYAVVRIQAASKSLAFRSHDSDFSAKQSLVAPTASNASITFRPGTVEPTNPVDGDAWYKTGSNPSFRLGAVNKQFAFLGDVTGGGAVTVSDTAPATPAAGQLWFNSATAIMSIWYVDPSGPPGQWVAISPTQASPYQLSARRISEGMQVLAADAISFEVVVPANAKMAKMTMIARPSIEEGYPTCIFMNGSTWVTAAGSYINANITQSGATPLQAGAGASHIGIFLGSQANQNVPCLVEMTFGFVGQPQVVARQHAYSTGQGESIGLRAGVCTTGFVPSRIGFQVDNGAKAYASGSCVQYEFWG